MATGIVCLACGQAAVLEVASATACPNCGADLPEQLRLAVTKLARAQRPFLLTLSMAYSWFGGAILAFVLLGALSGCPARYSENGVDVTRAEFLENSWFILLLGSVLSLGSAWGLTKHRWWSREFLIATPLLLGLSLSTSTLSSGEKAIGVTCNLLLLLPILVFWYWYLYRKPNVAAYYKALRLPANTVATRG